MRALAQRSGAAAKEIKDLIDASTRRVADGATLAGQAGQTMRDIVDSIGRVTGIMNEIVASSREQASGIGQVNQAIVQMDGVTQQNAALVEQSAAAARAMHEQARALAELVALFHVDGRARPAAPKPALPPAHRTVPAPTPASAPTAMKRVRPAPAPAAPRTPARKAAATADADWEAF